MLPPGGGWYAGTGAEDGACGSGWRPAMPSAANRLDGGVLSKSSGMVLVSSSSYISAGRRRRETRWWPLSTALLRPLLVGGMGSGTCGSVGDRLCECEWAWAWAWTGTGTGMGS
jgi:hypothetical protein